MLFHLIHTCELIATLDATHSMLALKSTPKPRWRCWVHASNKETLCCMGTHMPSESPGFTAGALKTYLKVSIICSIELGDRLTVTFTSTLTDIEV
jgi:hypothetical protein